VLVGAVELLVDSVSDDTSVDGFVRGEVDLGRHVAGPAVDHVSVFEIDRSADCLAVFDAEPLEYPSTDRRRASSTFRYFALSVPIRIGPVYAILVSAGGE